MVVKFQPKEEKEAHVRRMILHLEAEASKGKRRAKKTDPFDLPEDGPSLEMQRALNESRKRGE